MYPYLHSETTCTLSTEIKMSCFLFILFFFIMSFRKEHSLQIVFATFNLREFWLSQDVTFTISSLNFFCNLFCIFTMCGHEAETMGTRLKHPNARLCVRRDICQWTQPAPSGADCACPAPTQNLYCKVNS